MKHKVAAPRPTIPLKRKCRRLTYPQLPSRVRAFFVLPFGISLMEDLVDHFVKLDRMPEGFDFPPDLKDRIRFDNERRELVFRGYMSKSEFDRLCQLTQDWKFRRTLEELFCLCVPDEPPPSSGIRRLWDALRHPFVKG